MTRRSASSQRPRTRQKITLSTKQAKQRRARQHRPRSRKKRIAKHSKTEAYACAELERVFGPCDERSRTICLPELGITSSTRTASGRKRKRSVILRQLEFDYIRDDVLRYPPARTAFLAKFARQHHEAWPVHLTLPRVMLTFEIDGLQHACPVRSFGGKRAFDAQEENDYAKGCWVKKQGGLLRRVPNYTIAQLEAAKAAVPAHPKTSSKKKAGGRGVGGRTGSHGWTCSWPEFEARLQKKIIDVWAHIMYRGALKRNRALAARRSTASSSPSWRREKRLESTASTAAQVIVISSDEDENEDENEDVSDGAEHSRKRQKHCTRT